MGLYIDAIPEWVHASAAVIVVGAALWRGGREERLGVLLPAAVQRGRIPSHRGNELLAPGRLVGRHFAAEEQLAGNLQREVQHLLAQVHALVILPASHKPPGERCDLLAIAFHGLAAEDGVDELPLLAVPLSSTNI